MKKYLKKISVVFPAYNESKNIEICVVVAHAILKELVEEFEIIIVNDGSKDETGDICRELENKFSNIKVIFKTKNEGYGYALRDGFKEAKYDLLFFSDSDRQFDIFNLKDLLDYSDDFDIVVGYRKKRQDSFKRRILSSGYNFLIRRLFGLSVKDVDCAFKLFKRSVFEKITIESQRYFVNTEILAKAVGNCLKIKQIAVSHFPRHEGVSSVGFYDIPRTISELIRIKKSIAGR